MRDEDGGLPERSSSAASGEGVSTDAVLEMELESVDETEEAGVKQEEEAVAEDELQHSDDIMMTATVKIEVESAPPQEEPAAAVDVDADTSLVVLEKGTRLEVLWEDEDPPTWYPGGVNAYKPSKGHRIWYDDGQKEWEDLDTMQWRLLSAVAKPEAVVDATPAMEHEGKESVVAIPSEEQIGRPLLRSERREVKLQEVDVVDGLVRCPGCSTGLHMADGGCNVTTCYNTAKHGGRYYYFCAHCFTECPDGDSMCTSCPSRNDRQTRKRVQARRKSEWQNFVATNSADNPCEIDV